VAYRALLQILSRDIRSQRSPIHNNRDIRSKAIPNKDMDSNKDMRNPNRRILWGKLLRLKKLRP
jgi:hypothetical protein